LFYVFMFFPLHFRLIHPCISLSWDASAKQNNEWSRMLAIEMFSFPYRLKSLYTCVCIIGMVFFFFLNWQSAYSCSPEPTNTLEEAAALSKSRPPIHSVGKSPTCCQWKHKGWPWVPQKIFRQEKEKAVTVAFSAGRVSSVEKNGRCWKVYSLMRKDYTVSVLIPKDHMVSL